MQCYAAARNPGAARDSEASEDSGMGETSRAEGQAMQ